MKRRDLLRVGGLGILGILSGCRGAAGPTVRHPRALGASRTLPYLAPVRASWDRVIRTTVGLRPYRRSGFLVRAESLADKLVVHNYGHGGAGHSLSWGTARLAVELALEHTGREAAVIGCGIVGLTTARQLQRSGFDVTIYAESVPPDTTSNKAWASYTPTSGLIAVGERSPAWDTQFRRAARIGYERLQELVGRGYGISWIDGYSFRSERPAPSPGPGPDALLPADLRGNTTILGPGEHPFPAPYALRRSELRIEPAIYLDRLMKDYLEFGGRIVIRTFRATSELLTLDEPVLLNCTGLGARGLFGDAELSPIKGQLTILVPQADVDYMTFGGIPGTRSAQRSFGIHMMPRSDGIALGGTSQRGVWDLRPDAEAREAIVNEHIAFFAAMRAQLGES